MIKSTTQRDEAIVCSTHTFWILTIIALYIVETYIKDPKQNLAGNEMNSSKDCR